MSAPRFLGLVGAVTLAACGPGKASMQGTGTGGSGGTGGASSSATSTSGTAGTATTTTGTGTSGSSSTTGAGTSTSGATSTSGTSTSTTTGASSTGCDLMPVGGTGTGTGGGMDVNPYGPCETDEDCVTDYNLQWCIPGRCAKSAAGSLCMPPWESCLSPGLGPANCPPLPEWMQCSPEDMADPEFEKCAPAVHVPTDATCSIPPFLETAYCSILCSLPQRPCPEGMICDVGGCVWPP